MSAAHQVLLESREVTHEIVNHCVRFDGPEPGRLAALHCRSIAVAFAVAGQSRLLAGQGSFERDPDLGEVLRIHFPGHADDGDFLLVDNSWSGEIESGHEVGCDFLVRL